MRPVLLDLFCGAGGAAMGYHRAGFDVVGIDVAPQPRYPFDFLQADAMQAATSPTLLRRFDAIHASPPCQAYSTMTKQHGAADRHPDLVEAVRELLQATGLPWVIENVSGAPLRDPVVLCGSHFDQGCELDGQRLQLRRHRGFETSTPMAVPPPACLHAGRAVGVYGRPGGSSTRDGLRFATKSGWEAAMDIDWMTVRELAEAIPPAYTQWVDTQLVAAMAPEAVVA